MEAHANFNARQNKVPAARLGCFPATSSSLKHSTAVKRELEARALLVSTRCRGSGCGSGGGDGSSSSDNVSTDVSIAPNSRAIYIYI
jgi:hypothetical protein